MFVRQCYRRANGKRHAYWALVESYRTERGPRQRVVAWLGRIDEAGRLGVQQAAAGREAATVQRTLFEDPAPQPRWSRSMRRPCGWRTAGSSADRGWRWS